MNLLSLLLSNSNLTGLELQASLERQSRFLRILIYGWLILHLIALVMMLTPPLALLDQFALIGFSFLSSLCLLYLNHRGATQLAAFLFCLMTAVVLILVFALSVFRGNAPILTAMLGSLLALSILFAGMLVSARAIFWFATLNVSFVSGAFLSIRETVSEGLGDSFPIVAFLLLIALISWLYQKTLNQALHSLTLARQEAAQARVLQRELEIAHNLQQQLYPSPPQYGRRICFAARCEPAHETGGDFYDFLTLDEDHLGIVVADVSGKSISAALVMAMTRSIIRHGAQLTLSPAEVLYQTNKTAMRDVSMDQMITVFYGILNTRTLEFIYANAGHPYPFLKRNGTIESLDVPGFPIKTFPDASYQNHTLQLRPGDQLIWISDGIVEAHNPENQLFGFERLEETIQRTDDLSPDDLLDHIWRTVQLHQQDALQIDDMTIVVANIEQE